jgi:hypothetical protein
MRWAAWLVAEVALIVSLGWQVWYTNELARCLEGDDLRLCAGPLPAWLMPACVAIAIALALIAGYRLVRPIDPAVTPQT